jgi:hypothetical protein
MYSVVISNLLKKIEKGGKILPPSGRSHYLDIKTGQQHYKKTKLQTNISYEY